jgi:VIT1/CCC1 family predicted Fe2+/Mn2+ transporter
MKEIFKKGFSFGLTSATITTLGLMIGLHSGTHSKLVVLGGILTIAIADAFSDSLGVHISEEFENKKSPKDVWMATIATFLSKFIFALTFVVPVLLFSLDTAIIVSIVWGLFMISLLSYKMAKEQNNNMLQVIGEHVLIFFSVMAITHFVGDFLGTHFGSIE